jgi:hypothetical protein
MVVYLGWALQTNLLSFRLGLTGKHSGHYFFFSKYIQIRTLLFKGWYNIHVLWTFLMKGLVPHFIDWNDRRSQAHLKSRERHEKRCDPAILDRRKILGEMWTLLPQTTRHFDKSGICVFWPGKTHKSKYL